MNERLTIQIPHVEIVGWLPIGRCEVGHGSDQWTPACEAARRDGANIGAAAAKKGSDDEKIAIKQKDVAKTWGFPLNAGAQRFFSSQGREPKEDARSSGLAEKDLTFYANRFT